MKKSNNNIRGGDRVKIVGETAPPDKIGKVGTVSFTFTNGAMVKLSEDQFTPVAYKHLQKIKDVKGHARSKNSEGE